MKIVLAFFACGLVAFGQPANFDELAKLFHVDPLQPSDAKLSATGGRKGVLPRKDVDPRRVAYVEHSFSAGVGAKLVGVEKRIQSFVLMANTYASRDYIYDEQDAGITALRNKMGEAAIENYFRAKCRLPPKRPHRQRASREDCEKELRVLQRAQANRIL